MATQQQETAGSPTRSPLTARPSVLVFDVNETLIDVESLTPLFQTLFGDSRLMREWLAHLFMYSMTSTLSGAHVDFFTLGQGLLKMMADIYHVDLSDEDLALIKDGMLSMPAHPDAAKGLAMLRDNGFRLITLTNSPPNPGGQSPLERAGLAGYFERQFSIESCRAFKPSPKNYRYVAEEIGVTPSVCMMVAAHFWDTIGAQCVGYSAALITRPGNAPLPVPGLPQPDIVVPDLPALARLLCSTPWLIE